MYAIHLIIFTVDTPVSVVEEGKVVEVVGDTALEGISELKDIVGDICKEGIELVLVVELNLVKDMVLLKFVSP